MTHSLIVYGIPAPQGSKSPKGRRKNGSVILIESSKKVTPWRQEVSAAVERYLAPLRPGWRPIATAQIGRFIFTMPKPKTAPKTIRSVPDRYPDASKLLRSTEDALVTAGLLKDDALLVDFSRLRKVYPGEDPEALDAPGVRITLDDYLDAPLDPSMICERCGGFRPTHKCVPFSKSRLLVPAGEPALFSTTLLTA